MNRLERRIHILKGKRRSAFDPNQLFFEKAPRSRVARKIRVALRSRRPVGLYTPHWSEVQPFLDDIAADLRVGSPTLYARTFSVSVAKERSLVDARLWVVDGLLQLFGLMGQGPFGHAVDRRGFRALLHRVLKKVKSNRHYVLMLHDVQHLPLSVRDDLIRVYNEQLSAKHGHFIFGLVMTGSVALNDCGLENAVFLTLDDFSSVEAVEYIVECMGPVSPDRVKRALSVVGGVPGLLSRLGEHGERVGDFPTDMTAIQRVLGPVVDDIRGAIMRIESDDHLANRLEQVANAEWPLPFDVGMDLALVNAGLVLKVAGSTGDRVELRAPLFGHLNLS